MNESIAKAYALLNAWKQENYIFGLGVMDRLGGLTGKFGKRALVVGSGSGRRSAAGRIPEYLRSAGIEMVPDRLIPGAKPNAPREDVYRLESYILHYRPDCIVAIGGGSTIDACKAASVLAACGEAVTPEIDAYFGTGKVSEALKRTGLSMTPVIAVQTSASSGAHLTKYSNVTDPVAGQKLLIVDPAIVPAAALFDYETTVSMPAAVTIAGALDAIAHTFEVFCGAKPETCELTRQLAETAIDLVLTWAKTAIEDPANLEAREALGLASDLGGYAIMTGGTSGAHLTSFSLVDLVSHGTACGIMNPYYAVFYSPAIQPQLAAVGAVLARHGFLDEDPGVLQGRKRAEAVAAGLIAFGRSIGAPTTLGELKGFSEAHVQRILTAAKDPQLSMKLRNMPVPVTAEDMDSFLEPVIRAAVSGDFRLVVNK